jgi:[acyl-carrier-protein] S-malonyltransferase
MSFAALFPGQGSQFPGMGKYLFENFKVAKETFEQASDALNLDMKKLCFNESEEELAKTHNTQPAIITVSIATLRVLQEISHVSFKCTAGHSVGEYGSMIAGHVLNFEDAIKAVRKRGEYMQEAVPVGQGGMIAVIGLTPDQTEFLCRWAEKESQLSPLSPANYNSPGQIVCSGSLELIDWLRVHFKKEIFNNPQIKVKLIPLKVSAPFHCEMMKPAELKMKFVLIDMDFKNSQIPIIQNFTARPETKADILRTNLISQISGPVLWMQSILEMKDMGVSKAIELGAGTVISSLVKKIDPDIEVFNLNNMEEIRKFETFMRSDYVTSN